MLSIIKRDLDTVSTYCFSFRDFVRLQTEVEILCLHTKGFFAEDFINTCQNKHMKTLLNVPNGFMNKSSKHLEISCFSVLIIVPFPLKAAINGLYFCSLSSNCRPPSRISLLGQKHKTRKILSMFYLGTHWMTSGNFLPRSSSLLVVSLGLLLY